MPGSRSPTAGVPVIVDVDTHWESTRFPKGQHPLEGYQDRLPDGMGG
jgi:hypothetical protein